MLSHDKYSEREELPIPLWRVLYEELVALRGPALGATTRTPRPEYEFCPADVLDSKLLREQIADRGLINLVGQASAEENASAARGTLQLTPEEFTPRGSYYADVLNRLLDHPYLHKAFSDLPESQWITQQNSEGLTAETLKRFNRVLLDRAFAGAVRPVDERVLADVIDELHNANLSALCFSGGGIRSATFCLGVLQGLARKCSGESLLEKFDYLSTVSGGGYLGGWLAAWTHWSKGGLSEVVERLTKTGPSTLEPEADPIFYLRNFSNYLTPRKGLFSVDTWTLLSIYFRNLLLNWIVLVPLLIAFLTLPRVLVAVLTYPAPMPIRSYWEGLCLVLAVLGFACAISYQEITRPSHLEQLQERAIASKWSRWWLRHRGQQSFLGFYLAPLIFAAFILAGYVLEKYLGLPSWVADAVSGRELIPFRALAAVGAAAALLGWFACAFLSGKSYLSDLAGILLGALIGVALIYVSLIWWSQPNISQQKQELYLCLAPSLELIIFLLGSTVFAGIATFWTDDEDREYWARMGAWVLIGCFSWTAFGAISLFGPEVFRLNTLWGKVGAYGTTIVVSSVTTYLGWSDKTPALPDNESPQPASSAPGGVLSSLSLQRVLPILAAISLVLILAVLSLVADWLVDVMTKWIAPASSLNNTASKAGSVAGSLLVFGASALIGIGLSRLIDPNEYSLHGMYRNRLIRAYLGASRDKGERKPNPFSGFDPADNIAMSCLWKNNPSGDRKLMPFINMTLNLVAPVSKKLAWQERKAESFTITPLHSGSCWVGYRPSSKYALQGNTPITLGTATAISGAAVSPNMGYNSSPIVSMLLALFNVRLGWWLGNPGPAGYRTYSKSSPGNAAYVVSEALGRTKDEKPYVYLSDGGHFENLGLYEMVLRRCRTIVVVDADEDHEFTFDNLGNAIRKIRTDFGISIEFPKVSNFRKHSDGGPTLYCCVGRICYDRANRSKDGHLVYIKPTIRGDESVDILSYEKQHPQFPHETTADQWFAESQFESYRALGEHEITRILEEPNENDSESDTYAEAREILRNFNSKAVGGAQQNLFEVVLLIR